MNENFIQNYAFMWLVDSDFAPSGNSLVTATNNGLLTIIGDNQPTLGLPTLDGFRRFVESIENDRKKTTK